MNHEQAQERSEIWISIRINKNVKEQAERIFDKLGTNISGGVNFYLNQVINSNGIPLVSTERETAVAKRDNELPLARYDAENGIAYMEYPDGRREYATYEYRKF